MDINNLIIGEELDASLETTLAIEQFLSENYRFRRNLLNGKVEFAVLPAGAANSDPAVSSADNHVSWRPLTQPMILSATIWTICPLGMDRTTSPSSSAAFLALPLSSRDSWPPGCARLWLIGARWTACTAMSACLH